MPPVRIVFLGTGNAFNTDGRGSQSIWVEPAGEAPFLVDIGPTALASMQRLGLSPGALDLVLFTHLHGDHTAGWPFLVLHDVFLEKRSRAMRVVGPTGTRRQLEQLCLGVYPDLTTPEKLGFLVEVHEVAVKRIDGHDAGGGIRFDVVPMEHHPTSIGIRLHVGGRTLAITGDTRWCAGVEELSRGCELFVIECSTLRSEPFAHVSLEDVREKASRLGARKTVLVHLTDEVARALEADPIPGVVAAHDGMMIEV